MQCIITSHISKYFFLPIEMSKIHLLKFSTIQMSLNTSSGADYRVKQDEENNEVRNVNESILNSSDPTFNKILLSQDVFFHYFFL